MISDKSQQQTVTLTIDQALQQAITHHVQGQLQDAERLYRAILKEQPRQSDANHNLGVLAAQSNQTSSALSCFKVALESNPNQVQYWVSYVDLLLQTNQIDLARQLLDQAKQRGLESEAIDLLVVRLEASEKNPTQALPENPSQAPKSLTTLRKRKKKLKLNRTKSRSRKKKIPGNQEINSLLAMYNAGRYAETITLAQKMTIEFPDHGRGWQVLGLVFMLTGRNIDALNALQVAAVILPHDAEVHCNIGITLQALARPTEAEVSYRRALAINPNFAEAHLSLGNTLSELGHQTEAEASYRRAVAIKPNFADAHNNLGTILNELGQPEKAEVSIQRALEIQPDFCEAHNNQGNTHRALGRPAEAMASYQCALLKKPDFATAHSNLGNTQHDLFMYEESEASYRHAIQLKPDFEDAFNNLASLLITQGKFIDALHTIIQSLLIKETATAKSIFVDCVKHVRCDHNSETLKTMVRALTEPWGRPSELVQPCTNFIKLSPGINKCVTRAVASWPKRLSAQELFGFNDLATVASDPLLYALLTSVPVGDIAIEYFLTMARHAMLEIALGSTASDAEVETVMKFFSALAQQCFTNEYVFSHTDDEIHKVYQIRDSLVATLETGSQVPVLWLVVVASYLPLGSLPLASRLLDSHWPEAVMAVLVQQIHEPEEELKLRSSIPQLTDIDDEISMLVRTQYEENPYPRWIKAKPAGKTCGVTQYLSLKFPLNSFARHSSNGHIDILVAGCGTGQHPIEVAQQFDDAHVLALDLSMSSLSYAKRKTQELDLTSIEYAQADLLKLSSLNRNFDVIESSGVLHHLSDPWAGWEVLLSVLRPGGFMKLGLYSDVARRNIVQIRKIIADQAYGTTTDEIRRLRQDLMNSEKGMNHGNTCMLPDFFSMSNCRDLLFHVQEHRVSLADINNFLRKNNLVFIGFELDANVLHSYKLRFPDDLIASSLSNWQTFENENPDTFIGMYQFWIQKLE